MTEDRPEIFVLAGVTAVGKTAFSLDWAERAGAEILSCDALLFYRGMDVGTAKPTAEERGRVPHHGIDLVDVREPFDVVRYVNYAKEKVEEIHGRGKRVLVVGGSGFYLKSFFAPVADEVAVPDAVRSEVRELEQTEGQEGMVKRLRELNPELPESLDLLNPRRVFRALERCLAGGETLLDLERRFRELPGPFDSHRKRFCLLSREPEEVEERIRIRTREMIQGGLVEETEALVAEGLRDNPSASRAVGYRETLSMLDGELPREELADAISRSTLQLASKQRKWFRNQLSADLELLAGRGEGFFTDDFPLVPKT